MKSGFTLLELLVASLLLSMLVTILTMIFNQSSIDWRTGIDSVYEMEDTRKKMGGYHDAMDDALPGLGQSGVQVGNNDNRQANYRTVSVFKGWKGGQLQNSAKRSDSSCAGRAFDKIDQSVVSPGDIIAANERIGKVKKFAKPQGGSSKGGYIVGVQSAGPDRDMSTEEDNITTYPEDVD